MDKVKIGFPIEYEDENNIVRNGLFLREPEIKELEKRLKEINKITDLKQQCKKQKEIIDKAIEYIEKDYYSKNTFDIDNIGMTTNKLLQVRNILKEVE